MSSSNAQYHRKRYIFISISISCIGFAVCIGTQAHSHAGKQAGEPVFAHVATTCPAGSDCARSMVENFLANSNLSDVRQETRTSGLSVDQIQPISDPDICQQLNDAFSESIDEYDLTYFNVGDFYFATQMLKQPEDADEVVTGLMMIYVLDSKLNFVKGYSG